MKLNANATFIKIPLAQIRETGNVRHEYDEDGIKELAESIRNNGLMNPITVKPAQEDENGEKTYELIAGHRRIRAYKYLCDQGDDFSMVECCIRTGNKLVLQIIENIQRADITPREKEDAIAEMLSENYSQADIARELSKPIQWVSDIVAGAKIRKVADAAGLNTEEITTKTLSQLRSIPEEKLEFCLTQLIAEGGTYRAATRMMQEEKNPATTHVSTPDEDFISDDKSMISPSEMSEEEFYDDEEDENFAPGTIINHAGKRLLFGDLSVGKEFVHANDKNSAQYLKVCKVIKIAGEYIEYVNGDKSCGGHSTTEKKFTDSQICMHDDWIYAIPDDAVAVENVDFSMTKTNTEPQQAHKESDSVKAAKERNKTKNLNPFNWYVKPSDPNAMASIIGRLPTYLLKMPSNTKICIQAGNHTAEIQSVIYEPENNRLIFRAFDTEFNEELKSK